MRDKIRICALLAVLLLAGREWSLSAEKAEKSLAQQKDFDAIVTDIGSFQKAFNAHDASAVAGHFTLDGEFVNDAGTVFSGRELIETEFAANFKALPKAKIQLDVVDVRFVGAELAIEEGTATVLPAPDAPAMISRYIVVHTKKDGEWKMASARDLDSQPLSAHDYLLQLSWLLGDWVDESDDARGQTSFGWSENGNFLVSHFKVTTRDGGEMSGTQRIGWDPQKKQFRSWVFDSAGGFAEGIWAEVDGVWIVRLTGVRPDGANGSATLSYTPISDGRFQYSTSERIVGGDVVPAESLTVVRRPPGPKPE